MAYILAGGTAFYLYLPIMNVLPNPLTPLAWLPPTFSVQVEIARYMIAATTGAWAWDEIMSLGGMIHLYSVARFTAQDAAHLLNKIAAGCFIITTLVFYVGEVDDCEAIAKASGWIGAITLPLLSVPFFFCALAVLMRKRLILITFAALWFATLGGGITSAFFIHGTHIGETAFCVVSADRAYSAGIVAMTVNIIVTFCVASFHLMLYSQADTWSERIRMLGFNNGANRTSKILLQSGMSYIIPIVVFNITASVVNLIPSMPAPFRVVFVVISVAIQSSMTSRLHTRVKLGLILTGPHTTKTTSTRTVNFASAYDSRGTTTTGSQREVVHSDAPIVTLSTYKLFQQDEKAGELGTMHEEDTTKNPVVSRSLV